MATLNSGGITIKYDTGGRGKPVLFIHGFASNYQINWGNTGWLHQFISHGRRIIALDLRGHGGSTKFYSPSNYHPRLMGEDIIRVMDHINIARADIVGYSMGAWLSAHMMLYFPRRINAVVLGGVGDAMINFHQRAEKMANALTTPFPNDITQPFLRTIRDFSELAKNDLRALAACTRGIYRDGMPNFKNITGPVLIITGKQDEVAGLPDHFSSLIPGAETIIVPECDHLTALTRKAYKTAVLDFLEGH